MLAAFHNNVWLVRHLIDEVKIDPNDPSQRTKAEAPQVGVEVLASHAHSSGVSEVLPPVSRSGHRNFRHVVLQEANHVYGHNRKPNAPDVSAIA